ncbi:hypothetical protein CK221_14570, partial [Mesorhizobium sp. WSM3868]
MSRGKRLISPLEGEMSPQATEGVAAREAPCWRATREDVGARRETTPSALPGISPARGRGIADKLIGYCQAAKEGFLRGFLVAEEARVRLVLSILQAVR